MDLLDRLQDLAGKIHKQRELIQTEEAAKNAFVMPFLSALGYDVFNPSEVVPEFVADVGISISLRRSCEGRGCGMMRVTT